MTIAGLQEFVTVRVSTIMMAVSGTASMRSEVPLLGAVTAAVQVISTAVVVS